jgi:glycerol-3-phosphate O-acyltransferase
VWPLSPLIRMMGAYFIRRHSRGALYRKVLARYVQMATAGGVAQGIFPEGGLSLTGKLMKPKLGLLLYLVEGHDVSGRDVVFVPVAINYDRVLEDRVLIAAAARGDRRFGARISVVVGFILRNFWQALRGRYRRFGTAAVAFGEPLSLQDFGVDRPLEQLGEELMKRIGDAMPVLIVPLLSRHLGEAKGPLSQDALVELVIQDAKEFGAHMPGFAPEDLAEEVRAGLSRMQRHKVIEQNPDGWQIIAGQEPVAEFYANSVTHQHEISRAVAE